MALSNVQPFVSIVVPCRNERARIGSCIRSILGQRDLPAAFEIIVADGMSDDGTRKAVRALAATDPRIRLVDNPGRIVSTGLNLAVRLAKGDVIIRMDAHTAYAPDYVHNCLDVLQATGAQNVGGPWVAKGSGVLGKAVAAAFQSPFASGNRRGRNANYEGLVDTVYLGCWPRDVFDRVGLFDEELVRNQDDEWNLRLTLAGGRVWQSSRIRSWYQPRESLGALWRQHKQYGYWKVRVIQKHGRPASLRHLIPAGFVLTVTALTVASVWWPAARGLWGAVIASYATAVLAASALTAAEHGWKLAPWLPVVFACYHLSYGYGFLRGICDFVVLRRAPHPSYASLTRLSAGSATPRDS